MQCININKKKSLVCLDGLFNCRLVFTGVVSGEGLNGQIEQRPAHSEGI